MQATIQLPIQIFLALFLSLYFPTAVDFSLALGASSYFLKFTFHLILLIGMCYLSDMSAEWQSTSVITETGPTTLMVCPNVGIAMPIPRVELIVYLLPLDLRGKFSAIHREYSPNPRKFYAFCTSVTDTSTTAGIIASGKLHPSFNVQSY